MRCLFMPILLPALLWADARPTLNGEERTNGEKVLKEVAPMLPEARAACAQVLDEKGGVLASAVWVGADGYFLTKASETPDIEKGCIRWQGAKSAAIREIRRLPGHDLLLAQAVGVAGVKPVVFDAAAPLPEYGEWTAAPVKGGAEIRIGVISARARGIPGLGAAMGIRMDEKPNKEGVRILSIAEDSPAGTAGLQGGDVILRMDGEAVGDFKAVHESIKKRQPGDQVQVTYRRKDKEAVARVRLASRTRVMMNWEGEDFANGGISVRTDHFARVLQHDLPLGPQDMGGPLYDLKGRALGINIARVDRVTTFALPAGVFWKEVALLIEADRHPPRAIRP
jgi:serine protease Do